MGLKQKIQQLGQLTRARDWRLSFVPVIIGFVYFWLFWFDISITWPAVLLFFLSLVTSAGFASLGYYINELFDIESDKKAGKINKLALISPFQRGMLLLAIVGITFLPWLWLPADRWSWILIAAEVIFFLVYSLPFPRLKNKALVSGLVDAAYAYVIPMLLSLHTYELFAQRTAPPFFAIIIGCFFIIGYRNILVHQVNDVFKDMRSGVVTLPQKAGTIYTSRIIYACLILEVIGVISFFAGCILVKPAMVLCLAIYFLFLIYRLYRLLPLKSGKFISIHPLRHLTDPFYQQWFPILLLAILICTEWKWVCLLPFHVLLVASKPRYEKVKQLLLWLRNGLSLFVNYGIYYAFKIFGIDLIKEKKSVVGYMKYRMRKKTN